MDKLCPSQFSDASCLFFKFLDKTAEGQSQILLNNLDTQQEFGPQQELILVACVIALQQRAGH